MKMCIGIAIFFQDIKKKLLNSPSRRRLGLRLRLTPPYGPYHLKIPPQGTGSANTTPFPRKSCCYGVPVLCLTYLNCLIDYQSL